MAGIKADALVRVVSHGEGGASLLDDGGLPDAARSGGRHLLPDNGNPWVRETSSWLEAGGAEDGQAECLLVSLFPTLLLEEGKRSKVLV